jgi:hypothetical protein
MRRMVIAWLPALALLAAGPTSAAVTSPALTPVKVAPRSGGPETRFALSFQNPSQTGRTGLLDRRDVLSVSGARGHGCRSGWSRTLAPAQAGAKVRVILSAGRSGWCTDRFAGQIIEYQRVVCSPGQLCPAFEVAPRTIARFDFRVRRRAPNRG